MKVDVRQCARCGQDHEVEARPLTNPVDQFDYWALCPVLHEPIRIGVLADRPSPPAPAPRPQVLRET